MTTLLDELRAHSVNRENHVKDGRSFALVLQGGGMRGVYSAGAVATLLEYGLQSAFDHVIGVSAGALHAAYFLANDQETMRNTYKDDLTNKNFVNLLRREKKVDIDYLVDLVLKHKHPIDMQRLQRSDSKLHVVMTDAHNGHKVVIDNHNDFKEIYEEFRATAALPFLYDKPVLVQNRYYIDGGVADLLPVDIATKLGCTDIVVVMTARVDSYRFDRHHQRLVNHLIRKFSRNQPKSVKNILPTNERLLQANLRLVSRPLRKAKIYLLQPSDEQILVSIGSIDKPKVTALGELGVTNMDEFLNSDLTKA